MRLGSQELAYNRKGPLIFAFYNKICFLVGVILAQGKAGIFRVGIGSLAKLHENCITVQISVLFVIILLDVAVAQH